ncbi:MAG: VanZ family protein [Acidobacteria bacterium]|nr:VanZ family protein [Acidobacteriota bacterium]
MRRFRSNRTHRQTVRRTHRRKYRALTWIWALVGAVLLLVPGGDLPGAGLPEAVTTAVELGAHLAVFLALAYLAARGYGGSRSPKEWRSGVLAAVLAYCVLLEILQIAIPGRGFEFVDIAIGWLGAVLGFGRRG